MELRHEFTVPASVEETWVAFNDIESVAACFPGATVTSVEGDTFQGSCKVKLGPIAMVYSGTGTFVEKDESARRFVIDAKGKDKRGNGTAGAHVTATLTEETSGTKVEVLTDLAITGKPAQFGRGVMQDVSDKLLGQFTDCLEQKVGASSAAATEASATEPAPSGTQQPTPAQAIPAQAIPEEPTGPVAGADQAAAATFASANGARPAQPDDALDLGATVLPVLVKSYWRQALAVLVVLLVLRRLMRRG